MPPTCADKKRVMFNQRQAKWFGETYVGEPRGVSGAGYIGRRPPDFRFFITMVLVSFSTPGSAMRTSS